MDKRLLINQIKQLYKQFYGSILLLSLLMLAVVFRLIPILNESTPIHITLERYNIAAILILVPVTLKWFANHIKKNRPQAVCHDAGKRYRYAYLTRLYLLNILTLLQIILFGLSRNTNFFWLAVVLFLVYFFCKPSLSELENLLQNENDEHKVITDNQLEVNNNDSTSRE